MTELDRFPDLEDHQRSTRNYRAPKDARHYPVIQDPEVTVVPIKQILLDAPIRLAIKQKTLDPQLMSRAQSGQPLPPVNVSLVANMSQKDHLIGLGTAGLSKFPIPSNQLFKVSGDQSEGHQLVALSIILGYQFIPIKLI